nr:reverse transcriptase domain-containing protein [Tanacetum cinerariifolium]
MQNQLTNLTDLITKFVNSNSASTSSSSTLPSNTIANPRSGLKEITTRSGVSYDGPQIPPSTSFLPKVVENEQKATKDTVNPTNNENTEYVHLNLQFLILSSLLLQSLSLQLLCINLMPFSMWKRLSLPDLKHTCMTLELADCLIFRLVGVAEDVYVKVGELTLRVGKEAITFNLHQTLRYSANYSDMTAKRIDAIDMASFLNDDPSLPPPNQRNYMPEVRKELKICEAKYDKSSVDEPPTVELKDLPPHLEYAFLEGDDKLLVIIAKDLSIEEKTALITILKSHKRAIA